MSTETSLNMKKPSNFIVCLPAGTLVVLGLLHHDGVLIELAGEILELAKIMLMAEEK